MAVDLFAPFRRVIETAPIRPTTTGGVRGHSMVAAGARIRPESSTGQASTKPVRKRQAQKWQQDAYTYRRAVPEVRYAMRFLANAARQITPIVAAISADGEDIVDADEAGLPPDLVAAARDLLARVLTGRSGGAAIVAPIVEAFEIAGECYLIGIDQGTHEEWQVRSVREVEITAEGVYVRDAEGTAGTRVKVDLSTSFVGRLWVSDPEFVDYADSPMRPLLDTCEELLLIRKRTRAIMRSGIAGNGFLKVPDEMTSTGPDRVLGPDDDPADFEDEDDAFMVDLTENMTAPIANEGHAASVVPMVVRGPAEALKGFEHVTVSRPLDPALGEREKAGQYRLGVGLDVPPEIITGLSDVNHWTAWQIDASTYRHHVAPITDTALDAFTIAYLREYLIEYGLWQIEDINRVLVIGDPTRLVQAPNRGQDAMDLHGRNVLSDRALVEAKGFDPDNDMPSREELLNRLALERGAMDGAITEALLRLGFGPLIDVLRTTAPGQISVHTGQDAQDAERDNPPASIAGAPAIEAAPAAGTPEADPPAGDGETDPPADGEDDGTPGAPITSSAAGRGTTTARSERLSRRLMDIDRRLRDRLHAAAEAAVSRTLERAGNRLRSATQGDDEARGLVAGLRGEDVPRALGTTRVRAIVAALGSDEAQILADQFDRLRGQYDEWTAAAQEEALDVAAQILGLDRSDPQVMRVIAEMRDAYAEAAERGWAFLADGLNAAAERALYDPAAEVAGEIAEHVSPSLIRGALAIAGGLMAERGGIRRDGTPATPGTPLGGIGTGDLTSGWLRDSGSEIVEYEWAYGISRNPFPPHQALDGVRFADFDDPALNTDTTTAWLGDSFAPGDHRGCHCDYMPHWSDGTSSRDDLSGGPIAAQTRLDRADDRAERAPGARR